MASTPLAFASSFPITVRSSTRKPDPTRKPSAYSPSSPAWWAPIFGWSSDPDYVDGATNDDEPKNQARLSDPEPGPTGIRSRFVLGCFTEEKAKQMRRKTTEGNSFHEAMYHSAIASRLASDVSGRAQK